ncbi:hypothetical protein PG984_015197 [Apiospora sp. TS-2023a]
MAENRRISTTPSPLSQATLIASIPAEVPSYQAADMSTSTNPTDDEPCNFNKLPPELRTEIWKLAASSDNNVLMISDRKEATVTIPPPVSTWVCQESRAIAFQYGHVYRVGNKWTWFSPEFDRVALDTDWTSRRWDRGAVQRELKGIGGSLISDVRHVLASPRRPVRGSGVLGIWADHWDNTLYPSIEVFPNLESIGIMWDAVMVSGGTWDYDSLKQLLIITIPSRFSITRTLTLIHEIETESQIIDEVSTSSFARSYPRDWVGKGQSVQRTEPSGAKLPRSQRTWGQERIVLHNIWNAWFRQQFVMTPTTLLPPLMTQEWNPILPLWMNQVNRDALPWMNQVKDRAPFVYPTVLVAHGNRLLKVADHPAFTEDELRELQRHTMHEFSVDSFGDEALVGRSG